MDIYPTCEDCQRELIPHRLWRAADNGDRQQWQREGKACTNGVGTCIACYARRARAKTSTASGEPSPIAPNTCTECETHMVRMRAWTKAPTEQRDQWRSEGLAKSAGAKCEPCYNAARSAARDPGHDPESPNVLLDGRWTLCPTRHVQVWEAA